MDPDRVSLQGWKGRLATSFWLLTPLLAILMIWATFGTSALVWAIPGMAALGLALVAGVVVRTVNARRFPVTVFNPRDVAGPAAQIEAAKSRLAAGDYAAFAVIAVRSNEEPEASAQIWVFAAKTGGIQRTSIELSYEAETEPAQHPALRSLLGDGWEIDGWKPGDWLLLVRYADVEASEAIRLLTSTLVELFALDTSTSWTFRAFA
jgi:uncharacterized membrane protein YraQ (UPF0718 family)